MTDVIEAMKASKKIEQSGEFGEIVKTVGMKIRPKFDNSFMAIIKLESSGTKINDMGEGVDIIENTEVTTMHRTFKNVGELAGFEQLLKTLAKDQAEKGITTKLIPVTFFSQDENGKFNKVEKYGSYGLQEWKVEPKK